MTVIVGLRTQEGAVIGCDSQATQGYRPTSLSHPKWVDVHGWRLAVSGHAAALDLIRGLEIKRAGLRAVVSLLRDALGDSWQRRGDGDGGPVAYDCHVLALELSSARLWYVDGTGCASEIEPGSYIALGSGDGAALGALYVCQATQTPPQLAVQRAVEAAIAQCVWCGPPVWVDTVKSAQPPPSKRAARCVGCMRIRPLAAGGRCNACYQRYRRKRAPAERAQQVKRLVHHVGRTDAAVRLGVSSADIDQWLHAGKAPGHIAQRLRAQLGRLERLEESRGPHADVTEDEIEGES